MFPSKNDSVLETANLGYMRAEFETAITVMVVTTDKGFKKWDILESLVSHIV